MNPKTEEILRRIKRLIKLIVEIVDNFPKKTSAFKIGEQIIDAVTSIGANFVEAQTARSKKEFVSTMELFLRKPKKQFIG